MVHIKNISVCAGDKEILKHFTLHVKPGEIHALMGPNGAGKSTLARAIAGDPDYEITEGEIEFKGRNLLELEPEERSHAGIFMGFQYPIEVSGITNREFLMAAFNAKRASSGMAPLSEEEFEVRLCEKIATVNLQKEFLSRDVNVGFSGGEKKRSEILQMLILEPSLAILDETDSGLDIDAMRTVALGIKSFMQPTRALILITHYQRLLDAIRPDFVHVVRGGRIVMSGTYELALKLEKNGYQWLEDPAACEVN